MGVDKEAFNLNTLSAVSLSRLAVKQFAIQGGGHIAVTSSLAGIIGVPFSASYTGSKHALHVGRIFAFTTSIICIRKKISRNLLFQGYFDCLRIEKIQQNVTVTMVCPGPIQTPFLAESFTAIPGQVSHPLLFNVYEINSNTLEVLRKIIFASFSEIWCSNRKCCQ